MRAYRGAERLHEAARARGTHAQRALRWGFEDDGSMTITVRLPAEQGALVVQAIHAAVDAQWRERDGADRELDDAESPVSARRADALCHIAEQFLAHEAVTSQQAERYQVVVHVDRSVLAEEGHGDCCHIEHGGAIAAETARWRTATRAVASRAA